MSSEAVKAPAAEATAKPSQSSRSRPATSASQSKRSSDRPAGQASRPSAPGAGGNASRPSQGHSRSGAAGGGGGGNGPSRWQNLKTNPLGIIKRRVEVCPIYPQGVYEQRSFLAIVRDHETQTRSFRARRMAWRKQAERAEKLAKRKAQRPRAPTHVHFADEDDAASGSKDATGNGASDDEEMADLDPRERRRRQVQKLGLRSVRAQIWPPPEVVEDDAVPEGGAELVDPLDLLAEMRGDFLSEVMRPPPVFKKGHPLSRAAAASSSTDDSDIIALPFPLFSSHSPANSVRLSSLPLYDDCVRALNQRHVEAAALGESDEMDVDCNGNVAEASISHSPSANIAYPPQQRRRRKAEKVIVVGNQGDVLQGAQYLPVKC